MISRIQCLILSVVVLICFTACNADKPITVVDRITSFESFTIDSTYATNSIIAYKDFIDTVSVDLANYSNQSYNTRGKLNYGVWVDIDELKEILVRADTLSELYIMNAIMGNQGDSTEVIFALKSREKIGANQNKDVWHFFDFTKPCPTYCPQIPGVHLMN